MCVINVDLASNYMWLKNSADVSTVSEPWSH